MLYLECKTKDKQVINKPTTEGLKMIYDIYQAEREQAQVLDCGLKVLKTFNVAISKPVLKMWRPKAIKPYIHYRFNSDMEIEAYIAKQVKLFNEHKASDAAYRESRKANPLDVKNSFKKGDLFYTSWGYDQTNYDYIVVLSVSASGKTVKCSRTSSLHMGESCQSNVQEPIYMPFGEEFNCIPYKCGESMSLKGSYPFLHTGIGSKRMGYFSKHVTGTQHHETMTEFGH